jgi:hypothetical protein
LFDVLRGRCFGLSTVRGRGDRKRSRSQSRVVRATLEGEGAVDGGRRVAELFRMKRSIHRTVWRRGRSARGRLWGCLAEAESRFGRTTSRLVSATEDIPISFLKTRRDDQRWKRLSVPPRPILLEVRIRSSDLPSSRHRLRPSSSMVLRSLHLASLMMVERRFSSLASRSLHRNPEPDRKRHQLDVAIHFRTSLNDLVRRQGRRGSDVGLQRRGERKRTKGGCLEKLLRWNDLGRSGRRLDEGRGGIKRKGYRKRARCEHVDQYSCSNGDIDG